MMYWEYWQGRSLEKKNWRTCYQEDEEESYGEQAHWMVLQEHPGDQFGAGHLNHSPRNRL